ncbi:predicted protein [Clavispora lusitaniae ATCC 42720]|uniref:PA14 domain-containing protein n=1 Tax=Clavispora lusitaniae (strain ATCC 42720) TaxID=306902 RepID=C4Y268_CLAL4|nr:uncharacterized protein CLUG_02300 [Clavispora lusitaniae ATCC 42720]EEQ38177.1 predicted protein [Clavispora lusitaniae ATCC 42720]
MIAALLLQLFTLVSLAAAGCTPSKITGSGFKAVGYRYPLASKAGWDTNFLQTGYKAGGEFFTINDLTDIDFSFTIKNNRLIRDTLYGQYMTISNFTIEYSGFFIPDTDGLYTWNIDNADDGAALSFVSVGGCCEDPTAITNQYDISTLRGFAGAGDASAKSTSANLVAGNAYAIKIVTFNWNGPSALAVSYTDPSGQKVTHFDHIHQVEFDNNNKCVPPPILTTTTTYGTNSEHPKTGTYTPADCESLQTCTSYGCSATRNHHCD